MKWRIGKFSLQNVSYSPTFECGLNWVTDFQWMEYRKGNVVTLQRRIPASTTCDQNQYCQWWHMDVIYPLIYVENALTSVIFLKKKKYITSFLSCEWTYQTNRIWGTFYKMPDQYNSEQLRSWKTRKDWESATDQMKPGDMTTKYNAAFWTETRE